MDPKKIEDIYEVVRERLQKEHDDPKVSNYAVGMADIENRHYGRRNMFLVRGEPANIAVINRTLFKRGESSELLMFDEGQDTVFRDSIFGKELILNEGRAFRAFGDSGYRFDVHSLSRYFSEPPDDLVDGSIMIDRQKLIFNSLEAEIRALKQVLKDAEKLIEQGNFDHERNQYDPDNPPAPDPDFVQEIQKLRKKETELTMRPILESEQEIIKRDCVLNGPMIIDGGPGTGKTTVLIQRISFLTNPLVQEELSSQGRRSLNDFEKELLFENKYKRAWTFFSPSELLRQYLRTAMVEEGLQPDPDQNVLTWSKFRWDVSRKLQLTQPANNGTDEPKLSMHPNVDWENRKLFEQSSRSFAVLDKAFEGYQFSLLQEPARRGMDLLGFLRKILRYTVAEFEHSINRKKRINVETQRLFSEKQREVEDAKNNLRAELQRDFDINDQRLHDRLKDLQKKKEKNAREIADEKAIRAFHNKRAEALRLSERQRRNEKTITNLDRGKKEADQLVGKSTNMLGLLEDGFPGDPGSGFQKLKQLNEIYAKIAADSEARVSNSIAALAKKFANWGENLASLKRALEQAPDGGSDAGNKRLQLISETISAALEIRVLRHFQEAIDFKQEEAAFLEDRVGALALKFKGIEELRRSIDKFLDEQKGYIKEDKPEIDYFLFSVVEIGEAKIFDAIEPLILSQTVGHYLDFRQSSAFPTTCVPQESRDLYEDLRENNPAAVMNDELDFILYRIFKVARDQFDPNQSRPFEHLSHHYAEVYKREMRGVVAVDEATDFSPFELMAMHQLSYPKFNSTTIVGDLMQSITTAGIRSWSEFADNFGRNHCPTFGLEYAFRQTPVLVNMAKKYYKSVQGEEARFQHHLADQPFSRTINIPPLKRKSEDFKQDIQWTAARIMELNEVFNATLPSIAVVVEHDDKARAVAEALRPELRKSFINAVACERGNFTGSRSDVRVYSIEYVKGLEFQAVILLGVDNMIELYPPDLLARYYYVGITRANYFLAATYFKAWPELLKPIENDFVADGNWSPN